MTADYLRLIDVAPLLGNVSADYLRRIARDRLRQPHTRECGRDWKNCTNKNHRRYPDQTHARFPMFSRPLNSRDWVISSQALTAFLSSFRRRIEPL